MQRAHREAESLRLENLRAREQINSANQELQSMNEELQSSNEELTTSKEETQSMNEELQTVNAELQSKLGNLSLVNDDLRNLLDSTDIAIVFLDAELNVRRFTRQSSRIVRLRFPGTWAGLSQTSRAISTMPRSKRTFAVLRSLVASEKEVATRDGRWYQVRIMPYRTIDNVVDGAVITFTDVSAAVGLELELRRLEAAASTERRLELLVISCQPTAVPDANPTHGWGMSTRRSRRAAAAAGVPERAREPERELQRAQQELAATLHRYTELYEQAPIGYVTLDARGRITQANHAARAMLQLPGPGMPPVLFTRYAALVEHERMSADIHDGLSQDLAGLSLSPRALQMRTEQEVLN